MDGDWQRVVDDLLSRVTGPMHFRLVLQPAVAIFFGIRDGVKDAHEGRPAYFWSIFTNSHDRVQLLEEGIRSVAKILVVAVILDAIFQLIEFRWFYPGEAILVALLLAFVPYLFIRGPANRFVTWKNSGNRPGHAGQGVSKTS
jgi:hypothetical protein